MRKPGNDRWEGQLRNQVRTRGGYVESDNHLPYQRESIYTQFRGDPELGFVENGISRAPDPFRVPGNFSGKGPKGYRRADNRIQEEICEILTRHPDIDATDIDVQVNRGIVTLNGTVQSRRAKNLVEGSIEHIIGIDDIENLLRVLGRNYDREQDLFTSEKFGRSNLRFGAGGSTREKSGRNTDPARTSDRSQRQ